MAERVVYQQGVTDRDGPCAKCPPPPLLEHCAIRIVVLLYSLYAFSSKKRGCDPAYGVLTHVYMQ
jgi:hypothetical protein